MIPLLVALAFAGAPDPLPALLTTWVDAPAAARLADARTAEADALVAALAQVSPGVDAAAVRDRLDHEIVANLRAKAEIGFPMDEDALRRTVIAYEAFKLRAYVTSGVFPKRYFGYLDGKWDSAAEEYELARTVHGAVEIINAWQAEQERSVRITDAEVAVTWIAEGGALLLGELYGRHDQVHAVLGIGLDDIHYGFRDHPELITRLDARFGTGLATIATWVDDERSLSRPMTFTESILGTAIMWVWEKEIADRKLRNAGRPSIMSRSLDEQFVLGSLVYNSGLIHNQSRADQVQAFASAAHLVSINRGHPDRALPVKLPRETLTELLSGEPYRPQWTSWIAVYHILQRYGGYVGLTRMTDRFDAHGMLDLSTWTPPAPPEPEPEPEPTELEAPAPGKAAGCGCGVGTPVVGWLALAALGLARRRRGRVSAP